MDSNESPEELEGAPMELNLAEISTVFGKIFISPFLVEGAWDHPQTPGFLSEKSISAPVKSVLLVQGTVRLYLTISAQEAFDILVKTAEAIRQREEC